MEFFFLSGGVGTLFAFRLAFRADALRVLALASDADAGRALICLAEGCEN
jgi:hypothetical protein